MAKAKQFFAESMPKDAFAKAVEIDKSKNHKDLPTILFYHQEFLQGKNDSGTLENLEKYFELYDIYRNAIGPLEYVKKRNAVLHKGEPITFLKLTEIIDGYNARRIRKQLGDEKLDVDTDLEPIWNDDRYSVYLADSQNKCVELGRGQTFCISRTDSSNMWPTYRKSDVATFYFVFDKTPNIESEGLVVVDARGRGEHVLTDKRNSTGYKSFDQYLKENPKLAKVKDIFKNVPFTNLEKILHQRSINLEDFLGLSPLDKNAYLSMGKRLEDDIWNVLTSEQKNVYINSGVWLIPERVAELSESQKKRYEKLAWRRIENHAINSFNSFTPKFEEIEFLKKYNFSDIVSVDIAQKAKQSIVDYYLRNGLYKEISDEDLENIVKIGPQLLKYVKGLSYKQMTKVASLIKKMNPEKKN